jgi:nitrite reductase/ring-hydroxylating ferredoxin subunit
MDSLTSDFVRAGTLEELKAKGRLVIHGRHRPILVVHAGGHVFALDNRCPHMGFPLDRGSVEDGILTCHWHHARFELASGCTFDLWADDVPTCPVDIRADGEIWVKPVFGDAAPVGHWHHRLEDGLAHNLNLVIAKAVQGRLAAGQSPSQVIRQAALFGTRNRDGWDSGLTILTALGQLLPFLSDEDTHLALFHGARRVAADCDGAAPRRDRAPLASRPDRATLKRWLRRWVAVRHRDAAERTVLTAIDGGASAGALADLLFAAETDHAYADGGHSFDFINKAFECLDLIGWKYAADVLPSVVGQMAAARGAEERTAWRQPVDLIALCEQAALELPQLFAAGSDGRGWSDYAMLAESLLADDPTAIIAALTAAAHEGASPADVGRALAYAAALRVARFGAANEHSDWETAHHVFTYANAVHQTLKRIGSRASDPDRPVEAVRALLHGAMALYLVDWQKRRDFVKDLDLQRAMIVDRVAQTHADLALDLMWRFMDLVEPVINRVDDSNGSVGDVFQTACEDLGAIAVKARPDPVGLADRVLTAVSANDYGVFDGLVTAMIPALGDTGTAHLKNCLALADRPRKAGGRDLHTRVVRRALQDIPDAQTDVDAYIALDRAFLNAVMRLPISAAMLSPPICAASSKRRRRLTSASASARSTRIAASRSGPSAATLSKVTVFFDAMRSTSPEPVELAGGRKFSMRCHPHWRSPLTESSTERALPQRSRSVPTASGRGGPLQTQASLQASRSWQVRLSSPKRIRCVSKAT